MVSNKINWYRCDKIVASIYTWLLFLPNVWKSSIKKRLAIHYVNLKRIFSIWPLLASSFCCFCLCVRVCVSFVLEPHWNKYNIYINLDNFCNIELWVAGVWIYAYRAANKQKKIVDLNLYMRSIIIIILESIGFPNESRLKTKKKLKRVKEKEEKYKERWDLEGKPIIQLLWNFFFWTIERLAFFG